MLAIDATEQWLYATLMANPTIAAAGVHNTIVSGNNLRAVVFQFQGGTRQRGVGNATVWDDLVYLVKTIEQAGSYTTCAAIRQAIVTTLEGARGVMVNGTVFACVSEAHVRYTEVDDGVQYRHAGQTWRIYSRT